MKPPDPARSTRRTERRRLAAVIAVALALVILAGAWSVRSRVGSHPGATWQPAGLNGQFVHSLALSQTNGVMLAGTESGVFLKTSSSAWRLTLRNEEIWSVALSPDGRLALAADNAGNVDVSHDGGESWRTVKLANNGVYAVTLCPGSTECMMAGGAGGVFLSRDGGRKWRQVSFIGNNGVDSFAWLPGNDRTVYAGVVSGGANGVNSILVSHDTGRSWVPYAHRLTRAGAMSVLATSHSVLAGTMGHAVWRVSSNGSTWSQVRKGLPPTGDHVAALTMATPTGRLFAGTEAFGVFASKDDGRAWNPISNGLPSTGGQRLVLGLLYSSAEHVLFAATPTGIYRLHVR